MRGMVIRAEHRFIRTNDMPVETIIWPWWYGALFYGAFGVGLLALSWWLGRVR